MFLSVFLKSSVDLQIIHFRVGEVPILPKRLDYHLLKVLGKKLVVFFAGDDIRSWHAYKQDTCLMERIECQRFVGLASKLPSSPELGLSLAFSESMYSWELSTRLERMRTVLKDVLGSIDAKHRILGMADCEAETVSPMSDATEGDLTFCTHVDMKGVEIGE
jgi:hypothetical protein